MFRCRSIRPERRVRGFNQAEVLAVCLGKRLGYPGGIRKMLIRDKKTKPQKELSAADPSEKSVRGIPGRTRSPKGIKTVLLVDDIYTTGTPWRPAPGRCGARG